MAQRDKEYKRLELLFKMLIYYLDRAYSDVELGIELETHDSNVWRIRRIMADELEIPIQESPELRGKYFIRKDFQMRYIHFSREEMASLYLAARRLQQQTKTSQEHVAVALKKLANAMHKPFAESLIKAAGTVKEQEQDNQQEQVFSDLVTGWLDKTPVRIFHHVLHGARRDYVVHPYHIEPSPWGDGNYLIGYSEHHKKIARFKIARIEKVVQTGGPYREQAEFDVHKFLKYAWGIWSTDKEPVTVKLRFTKRAIPRLLESNWPQARLYPPDTDASRVWEVQVAEWQEMESWVKGWGSQVEVLEPVELRARLISEVRRLARKYEIITKAQDTEMTRVLRCWGKTTSDADTFHPAMYHMLDVGHVAQALLGERASMRWKHILSQALNVDSESLVTWLPSVIALHDIGKISATFQGLNQPQKARLETEKFSFSGWRSSLDLPHAIVSQACIADLLSQVKVTLPKSMLQSWEEALGGHHGRFVTNDVIKQARSNLKTNEPAEWSELRCVATKFLKEQLYKNTNGEALPELNNLSAATAALTGFMIVCDWLGSDSRFFTPQPEMEANEYIHRSRAQAEKAVDAAGFFQASASNTPTAISLLFPNLTSPRPLQQAIDDIPTDLLARPCLAIIEAPTGEGKTEAGLALAHRLAQASGSDELYYALPTMATSNQMFGRLQKYLREQLGLSTQIKLVHGQAFLVEDDLRIEPLDNGDGESANATLEWFSPKKRALLAPFGVGTIDQVELAALNVRHTALRLIGLAGKVVIVDEVHAYDTYMTTIIERLLGWLSALNTSVILLSATLPLSRRARLVHAYSAEIDPQNQTFAAYPGLLIVGKQQEGDSFSIHHAAPTAWQPNRILAVSPLNFADDESAIKAKAQWLLDKIADGGCVCWITNTVKRAQKMCEILDALCVGSDVDVMLLHSQFPLDERQKLEEAVAQKYGPTGNRPKRGIVIGTQVLEQSLDLDFDLMVSDLAPIDLLLQRAGRLHRHLRQRPAAHQAPRLWVNTTLTTSDDLSTLGADARIYDEYVLRLTWKTILNHPMIQLPVDYRPLIEAIYAETEPATDDPLKAAWDKLQTKQAEAMQQANLRLLPEPDADWSFAGRSAKMMFEESENNASWIVAQTRLGEESLSVIPLEVDGDQVRLADDGWLSLKDEAPREIQLQLLRRGLRVSQYNAVQALKATTHALPGLFKKSALLKDCVPLLLNNHQAQLTLDNKIITFTLDPRLGLVIERQNSQKTNTEEEVE